MVLQEITSKNGKKEFEKKKLLQNPTNFLFQNLLV